MNVCLCILTSNTSSIAGNYKKIADRFAANNALITVEQATSIFTLRDQVTRSGSKYEKIIVVVLSAAGLDLQAISDAITDIAAELGSTQSISICDTDDTLIPYLTKAFIDYSDSLQSHKLDKKTPALIYNAVFGVKGTTVSKQTTTEIENVIKSNTKAESENTMSMPVPIDESEDMPMPMPVPVENDDEPKKKSKKGLFGFFKKKTRDEVQHLANPDMPMPVDSEYEEDVAPMPAPLVEEEDVAPMPAPILSDEDDTSMPAPIVEEEPEEKPSKPQKRTNPFSKKSSVKVDPKMTPAPVEEPEPLPVPVMDETDFDEPDEDGPRFIDDSMFTTEETEIPNYTRPEPLRPVRSTDYAEQPPEPVVEPVTTEEVPVKKKGFGKKNKINLPKPDKSGLSMQKRPRLVFVTGTGRIGQSTLVASLGFTAAQYFCNSLIVDMDMVRRAISCIYPDYNNPNSNQSMGLISAIRSPHLVDTIATPQYNLVSTLGLPITAEDNREIMDSVTPLEVQTLLLQALSKYNFVVVDMPWEYLTKNSSMLSVPSDILFVTSNDVMTMISDLNQLTEDAFATPTDFHMLISKMRFVLNMTSPENQYDGKKITEKNFTDVCYQLTEEEMFTTIPVIANIPILNNIGNQIPLARPASSFSEGFAAYCGQILHELK